jgi:hypothetical protein
MDIKSLSKLAKACRKLGISHLKTEEVEISLSPEITPVTVKKRQKLAPVNEALFNEPDAEAQQKLTDMDLLFWSSESAQ